MMHIGVAADHGGWDLKKELIRELEAASYKITDFGATSCENGDDYPDYVIPLARAVADGQVDRGIAVCGSGIGACIAANKVAGVRAGLAHDIYSAHQGVEDDNMNVLCLGGRVITWHIARELIRTFLDASFKGEERFKRRLEKVTQLVNGRT